MKYFSIVLTVFFLMTNISVYSQQENEEEKTDEKPVIKSTEEEDDDNDWDDFDPEEEDEDWGDGTNWVFGMFDTKETIYEAPFLWVSYSMTQPNYYKGLYEDRLNDIGGGWLKLGNEKHKQLKYSDKVFAYSADFVSLSNLKSNYGSDDVDDEKFTQNLWKIGLAEDAGYGYKLSKDLNLIFYEGNGMNWNYMEFDEDSISVTSGDIPDSASYPYSIPKTDLLKKKIRFGDQFQTGIKLQISKIVSLTGEYERNMIFPRHMFWYWAGSELVEVVAISLVDEFVEEIEESSPYFVPVVNAILKTGVRYGFSELRKKNMNWPISTVPPFMFDNFKVGISLNF